MGTPAILERSVLITYPPSCAVTAQTTHHRLSLGRRNWPLIGLGALDMFKGLFRGSYPLRLKVLDVGKALSLQMSLFPISPCSRPGVPLKSQWTVLEKLEAPWLHSILPAEAPRDSGSCSLSSFLGAGKEVGCVG